MYIVFVSAAVFIIHQMDRTQSFLALLRFHPDLILRGQVWRLVTWVFIPLNNNIFFTAIMLYFYYFVGSTLEREWGTAKFTIYYIFAVAFNILYGFIISYTFRIVPFIVPNYINLSMFFAFAVLFPDHRIMLFFIIPIKMKWMALVNALFFAYSIISELIFGHVVMALLPIVALLNFFIICGDDLLGYLRPYRARVSHNTIDFKKASRRARREQENRPYRHKCAVCGRTDAEYPDLEFRYCSRCNGYHCFCIEHINNHVHFN
jgi:membrane associated rhomboid family serine protease